jgi:hypothetical protein
VILSPQHAKRFMAALQGNIDIYEQTFGEIVSVKQPVDDATGNYH